MQKLCLFSCPEDSRMGIESGRSLYQTVNYLRAEMVSYFSVTLTEHSAWHVLHG